MARHGRNASNVIPPWLQKAIDDARAEGRDVRETGVAASAFSGLAPATAPAMSPLADALFDGMSEDELQLWVLSQAEDLGWWTAHFRKSQNSKGVWRTAVAGKGKGFPDLVLVRERVVYVELKSATGVQSSEQKVWYKKLRDAGQEVYLWRPKHRAAIIETLRSDVRPTLKA